MARNNEARGGFTPHNEQIAKAICRPSGYKIAMEAMASKTGSAYPATDKHNSWEDAGSGTAGNVRGWGEHE